jgi:type III secretory pathway component EscV
MRKVSLEDVAGPQRYAEMRDEFRRRIIELKRLRRVSVGDRVTLVFENFDTVLFQTQEMLLVEHITDIDRVREELDVYNALLPGKNELSATLLIEITDQPRIAEELRRLIGLDEHVSLRVGARIFRALFEPGRSTDEKLSAVQYVRFQLSAEAAAEFVAGSVPVELAVDHPNYRASTVLDEGQRASLAADLSAA